MVVSKLRSLLEGLVDDMTVYVVREDMILGGYYLITPCESCSGVGGFVKNGEMEEGMLLTAHEHDKHLDETEKEKFLN